MVCQSLQANFIRKEGLLMYLDPGFGSMLIQGIVAALAAGGAYLILMRKKIVAFFQNRKAAKNAANVDQSTIGSGK